MRKDKNSNPRGSLKAEKEKFEREQKRKKKNLTKTG